MKEAVFFERQTISSKVKAQIISEYFPSYCKIIVNKNTPSEIRYIDLFAGPGVYKMGMFQRQFLLGGIARAIQC